MATLKGKIIAITGAGSGIGWATAHECASRGASLALCDINKHSVDKLVAELVSKSAKVLGTCVDIGNSDNVDAWIAQIIEQFGRLDGAVNAAGIVAGSDGVIFSHIVDTSNEHWNSVLQINATGLFYCLRAELRVMEPGASIVNMSSLAGLMGQERLSPYIASKHAVIGLTRAAAKEAGAKGIRVNALAAGPVATPMLESIQVAPGGEELVAGYKMSALQKKGTPEEIAKTICFALSDDATNTTGAIFTIDAGLFC